MRAAIRFEAEISHLDDLHRATIYAYNEAVASLRNTREAGERGIHDPIISELQGFATPVEIASGELPLRTKLRTEYQQQLREVIFVRAISSLEVYLVTTVRELFVVRPDLFQRPDKLDVPYNRLLTFRSISALATFMVNRDIRSLQSGGFSQIAKYYRKHFDIDFNDFDPGLKRIQELHDRRHLLVHRLGRTDEKYRRDYDVRAKSLEVGRTYLLQAFHVLRQFVTFVDARAERLALKRIDWVRLPHAPTGVANITVRPITRRGKEIVRVGYMFEYDEELIMLQDLIVERSIDTGNRLHILLLKGEFHHLRNYIEKLKRLEEKGCVELVRADLKRQGDYRRTGLPSDLIAAIAPDVPAEGPLPDGLKRELAERYGKPISMISCTTKLLV